MLRLPNPRPHRMIESEWRLERALDARLLVLVLVVVLEFRRFSRTRTRTI